MFFARRYIASLRHARRRSDTLGPGWRTTPGESAVEAENSLAIAFAPDSQSLAVRGEYHGTITAFDTTTGITLWTVDLGPEMATGSVGYSPDGKTIVTGYGSSLRFLDAATGTLQDAH